MSDSLASDASLVLALDASRDGVRDSIRRDERRAGGTVAVSPVLGPVFELLGDKVLKDLVRKEGRVGIDRDRLAAAGRREEGLVGDGRLDEVDEA